MTQFASAEFERVTFQSIPSSCFCATVLQDSQFTTLTLVDRRNWHEYKLEIADFHTTSGVPLPAEMVASMLKKALELVVEGKPVELGPDTPLIDAELAEHGVIMVTLKGQMLSFSMEFKFPLSPVEVDKFTVLEAQLKDVREAVSSLINETKRLSNENAALKQELAVVKKTGPNAVPHGLYYFSLSADGSIAAGNAIAWNGASPRQVPAELIALAGDNKTVTVVRPGVYQVYARINLLKCKDGENYSQALSLRVNDQNVACCTQHATSSSFNGVELTELLPLRANDRLMVIVSGGSGATYATNTTLNSRFFGLFLSDI